MAEDRSDERVLRPDGIHKLLESGMQDLSEDERALLLALVGVDAEAGRELDEEEQDAVEKLKGQLEGYDVDKLSQAVKHMVTAKPQKDRELEWPELADKFEDS